MDSSNSILLKQISKGKDQPSASYKLTIPGLESMKKLLGKTSKKNAIDLALFSAGIYVMYRFGKSVAESIDNQMPTEKSMMDMMKSMPGAGGMPSPM